MRGTLDEKCPVCLFLATSATVQYSFCIFPAQFEQFGGTYLRKRLLLSLLLQVSIFGLAQPKQEASSVKLPHDTHPISSEELRTIGLDFVHALSNFYMATHTYTEPTSEVQMMTRMMDDNRWLQKGISALTKFKTHKNEVIRLSAEGTIIGAELARRANEDMLALMRNPSKITADEARYQVARYASNQKEAFQLIATSAPWITGMMYRPRTATSDSAPIAYTISKEHRLEIIQEIDRLFGEELAAEERGERKDNHNAAVFAAQAIRKNLLPETYADAKELEAPPPPAK
jgi:hypothetical protein